LLYITSGEDNTLALVMEMANVFLMCCQCVANVLLRLYPGCGRGHGRLAGWYRYRDDRLAGWYRYRDERLAGWYRDERLAGWYRDERLAGWY
jgi:hypothetical protein